MARSTETLNGFVGYLQTLDQRRDRAALASLRRGLGKRVGQAPEMFPYVVPWLPTDAKPWEEERYFLVASLFASHPLNWPETGDPRHARNLGASMAQLAQKTKSEGAERRFVGLLNADPEDLPHHLRSVVSLLASKDIPVDWNQLLNDLRWWDSPERNVQRRWARSFWGQAAQDQAELSENGNVSEEEGSEN
ncbi:hypothetical protein BH23CHL5_BH23CHL5_02070 [soil metagenome]